MAAALVVLASIVAAGCIILLGIAALLIYLGIIWDKL